jgi:hypothetical protein
VEKPIGKLRLVNKVKPSLTAVSHSGDPRLGGERVAEGRRSVVNAGLFLKERSSRSVSND